MKRRNAKPRRSRADPPSPFQAPTRPSPGSLLPVNNKRRLPVAHSARRRGRRPTVVATVADSTRTRADEQVVRPITLYAEDAIGYTIGSGAAVLLPVPVRPTERRDSRRRQAVTRQPTVNKPSHRIHRAAAVDAVVVPVNSCSASIRSTMPSKYNPTSPTNMYFHFIHKAHHSHGLQSTFKVTSFLL